MNPKTGFVTRMPNGRWKARVSYTDAFDRTRHQMTRTFDSKLEAKNALKDLVAQTNSGSRSSPVRTLHALLDYYVATFVHPAEIREGVKVAGYKGLRTVLANVATVRRLFPDRALPAISYDVLYSFRRSLFADTYTRSSKPEAKKFRRSIANVNRLLALVRHVLMIAERQRWIETSPFRLGPPLISIASERKRERALTFDEEDSLLAVCDCDDRRHIIPIIVCAIDTGMRLGEILKLEWSHVDLDAMVIRIPRENTKTERARIVGITERLRHHFETARDRLGDEGSIFGRRSSLKQSWATAIRLAGLDGLRFHDLRHTFATRLSDSGVDMLKVSRLMGHENVGMTFRYTNLTLDNIRQNTERMDAFNRAKGTWTEEDERAARERIEAAAAQAAN